MYALCKFKQLVMTFEHGLCPSSAEAFVGYGIILWGLFGDEAGASRMSGLARRSLDKIKKFDNEEQKPMSITYS